MILLKECVVNQQESDCQWRRNREKITERTSLYEFLNDIMILKSPPVCHFCQNVTGLFPSCSL